MTIRAQLTPVPQPLSDERATLGLAAAHALRDSFDLLDHRTRARVVLESLAVPGRYLAVKRAGTALLVPLDRPITHIGRGLVADVRLEDPRVSRRHAIIAQRGDRVRVLDDRSANGTFVGDRRITVAELRDGDVLRVGPVALRYVEILPRWRSPRPRAVATAA